MEESQQGDQGRAVAETHDDSALAREGRQRQAGKQQDVPGAVAYPAASLAMKVASEMIKVPYTRREGKGARSEGSA
jgi:hypothetical protein